MFKIAKMEINLIEKNIYIISLALIVVISIIGSLAGEKLKWGIISFEVILPIYASIASIEWAKAKSDPIYEVTKSINYSLFFWYALRVIIVESIVFIFTVVGILYFRVLYPFSIIEMIYTYIATAMLWVTISALLIVRFENISIALACTCSLWVIALLVRGLLRIPIVRLIFPLIRFAGVTEDWLYNKTLLIGISIMVWFIIAYYGRNRFE